MRYTAIALACALASSSASAETSRTFTHDNPNLRVRPTSALGRKVIDAGIARSATFRGLVQRLEQSDVIVYVQLQPNMPSEIGGVLQFMGCAGKDRYLRVTLGSLHHFNVIVALLGHELQHAAEVADAPDVIAGHQFTALYQRIGIPSGPGRFDSSAARAVGRTVQGELRGRPVDSRVARHAPDGDGALLDGGSIAMP
jgi:hypothetical protein